MISGCAPNGGVARSAPAFASRSAKNPGASRWVSMAILRCPSARNAATASVAVGAAVLANAPVTGTPRISDIVAASSRVSACDASSRLPAAPRTTASAPNAPVPPDSANRWTSARTISGSAPRCGVNATGPGASRQAPATSSVT